MAYVLPWRRKKEPLEEIKMFITDSELKYLRENPGIIWRFILPEEDKPINYLEIGIFTGEHVIDMSKSYCKHPGSKIYCVDPWIDYDEYSEYKGKIGRVYEMFVENMNRENLWDKISVHRDFSHNIIPTFEDDFFDIVFIDGNHETEFVYKDAVMSLPKVKSGGTIVFDDYDWKETKMGIHKFIEEYKDQLTNLRHNKHQLFAEKL